MRQQFKLNYKHGYIRGFYEEADPTYNSPPSCRLTQITVNPDSRGRGFGTQMLQQLEEEVFLRYLGQLVQRI
ncbi:MAG: GNAT family N-acetyltransferase [Candidatus Dojkabacteria bacterium]|nr:GNAT family N-acetyltransferase [Candidatus Dojkabacteria bacterium]MDQ7020422.1 GNAT family N-acetyltransferase [Candidatus Dojkabacteria bacterium]